MKVLLVYGTIDGQTEKIVRFVADQMSHKGHQTQVVNAIEATSAIDLDTFDLVIIAASLHAGRYQSTLLHFVSDHLVAIRARRNAFLSVSLAAASNDAGDLRGLARCLANFTR